MVPFCLLLALFLIQIYFCSKFCLSLLETAGLQVSAWYIRDFSAFIFCSSSKSQPPAIDALAANVVWRDVDVLWNQSFFCKRICVCTVLIFKILVVFKMNVYILFSLHNGWGDFITGIVFKHCKVNIWGTYVFVLVYSLFMHNLQLSFKLLN
jgi:hypothetical protein